MQEEKNDQPTRQLYAAIREDVYLAAKARATELRMPLRRFVEQALEAALTGRQAVEPPASPPGATAPQQQPSIWEDEYLRMQARQPLGTPVELSQDEAARVVLAAFDEEDDSG